MVSYGSCNKLHKLGGLRQPTFMTFQFWRSEVSLGSPGCVSSGGQGENMFSYILQLLNGCLGPLAVHFLYLQSQQRSIFQSLCLCPSVFVVTATSDSCCLPLIRTLAITWACPGNLGEPPHLKILNLSTSLVSLPYKVTFTVSLHPGFVM